ncbi:hypothetical protein E1B28_004425 [Marasmius oreades]|uniref:Mitochondrial calcium uniporter regulator 1 n=1 Tax=Marasmius oreades TaxID=181124 RepID=A0A9P8ACY2_9AGAR|nr:uncharacterized protein E1B28_004425 [Marasmius oreades]KAG7097032.1 hypothetical protein E1B28_004425 [Marasmius oreades]
MVRRLLRSCRVLHTSTTSIITLPHRDAHNMTDPIPSHHSVHLVHPLEPNVRTSGPDSANNSELERHNDLPTPPPSNDDSSISEDATNCYLPIARPTNESSPTYTKPPFHTHSFFVVLERTFPTEVASTLMRATRALLVDRVGRIRRDGLITKDLDNQAYLFRAALSELRSEMTLTTKNDTAAISAATTALRRDLERLDQKMKEDVATLKHEIQMDLDSSKNETKDKFKRRDIYVEDLLNRSIVDISDLRTELESVKWDNMRRAVVGLFAFASMVLIAVELRPKPPPPISPVALTPLTPKDVSQPAAEGLEKMECAT